MLREYLIKIPSAATFFSSTAEGIANSLRSDVFFAFLFNGILVVEGNFLKKVLRHVMTITLFSLMKKATH